MDKIIESVAIEDALKWKAWCFASMRSWEWHFRDFDEEDVWQETMTRVVQGKVQYAKCLPRWGRELKCEYGGRVDRVGVLDRNLFDIEEIVEMVPRSERRLFRVWCEMLLGHNDMQTATSEVCRRTRMFVTDAIVRLRTCREVVRERISGRTSVQPHPEVNPAWRCRVYGEHKLPKFDSLGRLIGRRDRRVARCKGVDNPPR